MEQCRICGEDECDKHKTTFTTKKYTTSFDGSSPPEIFVGRWNYPNVYAGMLAPEQLGDTIHFSAPEVWKNNNYSIQTISNLRNQLIYSRAQTHIKTAPSRLMNTIKELAMSNKSIASQVELQKPVIQEIQNDPHVPLIARTAPVETIRLQENPKIDKKVDYLVNDTDVKSVIAIQELSKDTATSSIIKLLSIGLLGKKAARKLVPTRWAITAVDDTLSKTKLKKIRDFKELQTIQLFNAEYLGNHYEFLLLPGSYSFEVIELSEANGTSWHDYESNFPRKYYADSVTGAYYANRLALTEHLEKIKRQAQCLVLREIRPEYNAQCGVGILRETSRAAFEKKPQEFNSIQDAFNAIQQRLNLSIGQFIEKSWLIKNYGKQKRITDFF